jgi:hypothetical protein
VVLYHELRRFDKQCSEINYFVRKALRHRPNRTRAFKVYTAHAVIKLHDAWASRCRELIVKSSIGGYQTLSGISLTRSAVLGRSIDPVAWLRDNWTTKRMSNTWEPDWHLPDQAIRAARLLGVANYVTIMNGLGAITITNQVRFTRNALVHSLPVIFGRYRDQIHTLGLPHNTDLYDFIYMRIDHTGVMFIDDWMDKMKLCLTAVIR